MFWCIDSWWWIILMVFTLLHCFLFMKSLNSMKLLLFFHFRLKLSLKRCSVQRRWADDVARDVAVDRLETLSLVHYFLATSYINWLTLLYILRNRLLSTVVFNRLMPINMFASNHMFLFMFVCLTFISLCHMLFWMLNLRYR